MGECSYLETLPDQLEEKILIESYHHEPFLFAPGSPLLIAPRSARHNHSACPASSAYDTGGILCSCHNIVNADSRSGSDGRIRREGELFYGNYRQYDMVMSKTWDECSMIRPSKDRRNGGHEYVERAMTVRRFDPDNT